MNYQRADLRDGSHKKRLTHGKRGGKRTDKKEESFALMIRKKANQLPCDARHQRIGTLEKGRSSERESREGHQSEKLTLNGRGE